MRRQTRGCEPGQEEDRNRESRREPHPDPTTHQRAHVPQQQRDNLAAPRTPRRSNAISLTRRHTE